MEPSISEDPKREILEVVYDRKYLQQALEATIEFLKKAEERAKQGLNREWCESVYGKVGEVKNVFKKILDDDKYREENNHEKTSIPGNREGHPEHREGDHAPEVGAEQDSAADLAGVVAGTKRNLETP